MRPTRTRTVYHGDDIVEVISLDVTWDDVRNFRDRALADTDFWALKDLTMSQAKKDYRQFLRDLPQHYDTANEATDAWNTYEVPS